MHASSPRRLGMESFPCREVGRRFRFAGIARERKRADIAVCSWNLHGLGRGVWVDRAKANPELSTPERATSRRLIESRKTVQPGQPLAAIRRLDRPLTR